MYPILFRLPEWLPILGGEPITSFGVFMLLAFLTAAYATRAEFRRIGEDPEKVWDLLFMAVVGGILGAKLYYIGLNWERLLENPWDLILSRAGLVWYGGFLGATALVVWEIRRQKLPLPRVADVVAAPLAIAYAVGRIGCFMVGDDWGRPTGSWVGIRFPQGTPPTSVRVLEGQYGVSVDPELVEQYGQVVPVHPTQLYEVGLSTLIFLFLWRIRRHDHRPGWLFMVWLILAGLERFVVEFVRVKDDRFFGPLSLAQVISLAIVAVGVAGIVRTWGERRPQPATA